MQKRQLAIATASTILIGCSVGIISPGEDLVVRDGHDVVVHSLHHDGAMSDGERNMLTLPGAPDAIYLNRDGRTYTAGDDDSAGGVSCQYLRVLMRCSLFVRPNPTRPRMPRDAQRK